MLSPEEAGPSDAPNIKEFELHTGEKVTAHRADPYGFWHMVWDKVTELPKHLQGHFTSISEVERAVKEHNNNLKHEELTQETKKK